MKFANSTLHPDSIVKLINSQYAFGEVDQCIFLLQGVNDTYSVRSERAEFVVRLYRHGWRSKEEIVNELGFVSHLAGGAAPVAKFFSGTHGSYIQTLQCPEGERYLVLMECASDSVHEDHAVALSDPYSYGRAVGLLHTAAEGFQFSRARSALDVDALIWEPLGSVARHFPELESELAFLRQYASRLVEDINRASERGLRRLPIHGDLTGGNANRNPAGVYTFFDFDCCGYGWQAYDLAVFLWSLLQNGKASLWLGFLDGYRSATPLDQADEQAIGLFVAARSFWIMGYSLSRVPALGVHSYKEALFASDVGFLKDLEFKLPRTR